MTVTKTIISDVIVPEVFNPYVIQRTAELSPHFIKVVSLQELLN
jgi:hypothetical protein